MKTKEELKAYMKVYQQKNADRIRENQRIWRKRNRLYAVKYHRKYYFEHHEAILAYSRWYKYRTQPDADPAVSASLEAEYRRLKAECDERK